MRNVVFVLATILVAACTTIEDVTTQSNFLLCMEHLAKTPGGIEERAAELTRRGENCVGVKPSLKWLRSSGYIYAWWDIKHEGVRVTCHKDAALINCYETPISDIAREIGAPLNSTSADTQEDASAAPGSMPTCKGAPSWRWDNCTGTYVIGRDQPKHTGDTYVGEFKNGKFHGNGTYYHLYDNEFKGDKYVGEHRQDQRTHGTYYFLADNEAKGDKYVGEFEDDKFHGQGTYYLLADNEFKGDKYVGEFEDGKWHGQGTYYHLSDRGSQKKWKGGIYVGQLSNGTANGSGTYTFPDNSTHPVLGRNSSNLVIVGEFVDWFPNGSVALYWVNGDVWVGRWSTSKDNDEGTWLGGEKYKEGNVPPEILSAKGTELQHSPPVSIPEDKTDEYSPAASSTLVPIDRAKAECEELGFTPKTETYGDCVLRLMEMN